MVVRTFLINALDFECFMGNIALGKQKKMFETCVKYALTYDRECFMRYILRVLFFY